MWCWSSIASFLLSWYYWCSSSSKAFSWANCWSKSCLSLTRSSLSYSSQMSFSIWLCLINSRFLSLLSSAFCRVFYVSFSSSIYHCCWSILLSIFILMSSHVHTSSFYYFYQSSTSSISFLFLSASFLSFISQAIFFYLSISHIYE